jgi:uncharacterized protein YmfQ (DUF2313 family)
MRTVAEQTQTLADYLPNGKLFAPKNLSNSNFRALLTGLAGEIFRAEQNLATYKEEINPAETTLFLDEWEAALGIPDSCFLGTGTVSERRRDVLIKLASLGVQTLDDFEVLATTFGLTATLQPLSPYATFPMTFPLYFVSTEREARFTLLVRFSATTVSVFPLTFPFTFGAAEYAIIQCLFNKLKPSNVNILYEYV